MNKNSQTSNLAEEIARLQKRVQELEHQVNERKLIEEKLVKSEEKFRILFETMEQGVVYQNTEGMITSANNGAQRILGLTIEQMKGRDSIDPRWKAIHEDGSDYPGETHPSMMALKTGKSQSDVIMGVYNPKDDSHRWISINATPLFKNGEKKPYQVYTTFSDITERKQTEEALISSEAKFRNIVHASPMGMHLYKLEDNARLVFTGSNPAADEILGVENELFVGKTIEEAFPPLADTEVPDKYREVAQTGKPWQTEQITYQDEKISGAFEVRAFQSSPGRMVAAFLDITDRKIAEAEREKLIEDLRKALDEVKKLSGMLPICASCKKIRDDKGYWNQIEEYLENHSEVEFTHGLCPVCSKKIYGDLADFD